WSEHFRSRFAGEPMTSVAARCGGSADWRLGEFVISQAGVEGSLIYALAAALRDEIERSGSALLELDLAPGKDLARLTDDLARPRGRDSLSNHLRRRAGLTGVKAALLREAFSAAELDDPSRLAAAIKGFPLRLLATRPIDEAISTAGGVCFSALDGGLMLKSQPGVFCAGEMLDWEAPTGGYLLTACFASGRAAGLAALAWLEGRGRCG
ncbi:MAG TPA: TIGR03862 family flavoprotein, partial [Rhodocyclaceae bacterium]